MLEGAGQGADLLQQGVLRRRDEALLPGVVAVRCPLQSFVEPADDDYSLRPLLLLLRAQQVTE